VVFPEIEDAVQILQLKIQNRSVDQNAKGTINSPIIYKADKNAAPITNNSNDILEEKYFCRQTAQNATQPNTGLRNFNYLHQDCVREHNSSPHALEREDVLDQ
jgi:hypothetical protein